ncbi:LacI family DNA-binding transcriptional regulator [Anaerovibrio sp.]|uniref:LacI family DNA-binding transcriptional regulator n=1 Tax=Anaerovibrio sp. TaxID=1872532 RepID=UPI003F1710C3
MAVTIRDVAALAGVSPATVSRTCNNNPAISAETREKVWQAIATLGYQVATPAPSATDMETGAYSGRGGDKRTQTIGIIMRPQAQKGYDNPFVTRSIRGISQEAMEQNYSTIVVSGETYEQMLEYVRKLTAQQKVQGFVFLYSALDDPLISYMHEKEIPFVVIGKASAYVNDTIYVDNDNLVAGQEAANYLISLGHKRIAFVCDNISQIFAYERHAGFRLSMMQNGLDVPDDYLLYGISMPLDDDSSIAKLLKSDRRPTALIIVDDTVALATLQICHEMGLKLPEDLSIITFNNSIMVKLANPPLTTIDVNSRQLGVEAASQLINLIEHPYMTATKIIVPHHLVERKSCQAPKE